MPRHFSIAFLGIFMWFALIGGLVSQAMAAPASSEGTLITAQDLQRFEPEIRDELLSMANLDGDLTVLTPQEAEMLQVLIQVLGRPLPVLQPDL